MSENIKTGNDIEHEIYRASETRDGNVDELLVKEWVSLDDFNDCLDLLFEVVYQACAVHPYGVQDCLDSMAMRTYADAMHYLAKCGRLKITKEVGRRVFATVEK